MPRATRAAAGDHRQGVQLGTQCEGVVGEDLVFGAFAADRNVRQARVAPIRLMLPASTAARRSKGKSAIEI
jgi:hypothetical protein